MRTLALAVSLLVPLAPAFALSTPNQTKTGEGKGVVASINAQSRNGKLANMWPADFMLGGGCPVPAAGDTVHYVSYGPNENYPMGYYVVDKILVHPEPPPHKNDTAEVKTYDPARRSGTMTHANGHDGDFKVPPELLYAPKPGDWIHLVGHAASKDPAHPSWTYTTDGPEHGPAPQRVPAGTVVDDGKFLIDGQSKPVGAILWPGVTNYAPRKGDRLRWVSDEQFGSKLIFIAPF